MKRFDADFKDSLRDTVEDLEMQSGVELVATVIPRVFRYWIVEFIAAPSLAFLVLSIMFFVETEFHYMLIYFEVLGTFCFVFLLLFLIPGLKRRLIGQTRLRAMTELKARALFQEHQMSNTRDHIGVLIVFAFFERQALILRDVGAEEMVPPDEWEALEQKAQAVFQQQDIPSAILEVLQHCKQTFPQYIPPKNEPFNELPNELWLH